jgi:hypothetical protein
MKNTSVLVATFGVLGLLGGIAKADCNISEEKKQLLMSVFCGGSSNTPDYTFTGQGCMGKSFKARFEDTAIQAKVFEMCGDAAFAQKLLDGKNALKFIEPIATCVGETIDFDAIQRAAIAAAESKSVGQQCTPDLRAMISKRRPAIEHDMARSNDPTAVPIILEKLGLVIDKDGNVSER